tara:strand:+ start:237 stop:1124 length:888 start_codon:yes stop_codon:yes gene_type:complete
MPTIIYKQGEKSFPMSGGCLAVMGRTQGSAENVFLKCKREEMTDVHTVTFERILSFPSSSPQPQYLEVLKKYMGMFPFMRCVLSTPEEILSKHDCTFDAKNFTQNEVMFAMFHIRMLVYAKQNFDGKRNFVLVNLQKLVDKGVPFWKAYTLCMLPFHASLKEQQRPFVQVLNGDANTFCLNTLPVKSFKRLVSGKMPTPSYKGLTIYENAKAGHAYPQNISEFLSDKSKGAKMSDLLGFLVNTCHSTTGSSNLKDAFGHPIIDAHLKYDVTLAVTLTSLDKTLKTFGITGKGKIC